MPNGLEFLVLPSLWEKQWFMVYEINMVYGLNVWLIEWIMIRLMERLYLIWIVFF